MTKFQIKKTKLSITVTNDTFDSFNLISEDCEFLNYIGGSPYALSSHIYKVILKTLLSMKGNDCKTIKINASWYQY